MDTHPSSYFNSSKLLKASLLTITFTTIYFYKTGKQFPNIPFPFVKNDTANSTKPLVLKKKKSIYLTFDDGPNKGTSKVLDIIKQEQIPVTMFVIGEHVYHSPEQMQMWDSLKNNKWMEIANHSYTHAFNNKFSRYYSLPNLVADDFTKCADSLHFNSNIVRTPGRNIWRTPHINYTDIKSSAIAADSVFKRGFVLMGWDLEWRYTRKHNLIQTESTLFAEVTQMFEKGETKIADHLVILTHDRAFYAAQDSAALHRFIKQIKNSSEYELDLISKYPDIRKN